MQRKRRGQEPVPGALARHTFGPGRGALFDTALCVSQTFASSKVTPCILRTFSGLQARAESLLLLRRPARRDARMVGGQ
jgi:hypothetical protein